MKLPLFRPTITQPRNPNLKMDARTQGYYDATHGKHYSIFRSIHLVQYAIGYFKTQKELKSERGNPSQLEN